MKRTNWLLAAAVMTAGVQGAAPATDDDVEVTNSASTPAVAEATVVVTTDDPASEVGKETESISEERVEYRIVTSDDASKPQEYSIQVHSTVDGTEEASDDSKPVKARARVVVIGPDGKEKVFEVDGDQATAFRMKLGEGGSPESAIRHLEKVLLLKEGKSGDGGGDEAGEVSGIAIAAEPGEERYMIGVQCEPVSDVLRSHLRLGEHGLLVIDVRPETPAAEAGLQVNDIVVAISDKDLGSSEDLVKSIVDSDGKPLTLNILRAGEKQVVTVTPRKMKMPVVVAPATIDLDLEGMDGLEGLKGLRLEELDKLRARLPEKIREQLGQAEGGIRFRRVHPGVVVEGRELENGDVQALVERLKAQAEERAAEARERAEAAKEAARAEAEVAERVHKHAAEQAEMLHQTMREMREQMEAMRKQMKELEAELQKQKSAEKDE
jgi:membrane-associated protease RseP (regulator of RpoE activity)